MKRLMQMIEIITVLMISPNEWNEGMHATVEDGWPNILTVLMILLHCFVRFVSVAMVMLLWCSYRICYCCLDYSPITDLLIFLGLLCLCSYDILGKFVSVVLIILLLLICRLSWCHLCLCSYVTLVKFVDVV